MFARHSAFQSRLIWPPSPGHFSLRLASKAFAVPAQIICEAGAWRAIIDEISHNSHIDPALAPGVDRVWHGGRRITPTHYDWMIDVKRIAQETDPDHPALHPYRAINHNSLSPLLPAAR